MQGLLSTPPPGARTDTLDADLDERTVLTLTLIDSLPFLPLPMLEDWLPITADVLLRLSSALARQKCKARLWEVMTGGEMDVARSQVCVAWWGTRGGRETVLVGIDSGGKVEHEMSGALGVLPSVASKL